MNHPPIFAVILGAGKGTRMRSPLPKVLHKAAGRSLLHYVMGAVSGAGASTLVVVVGHGRNEVWEEAQRFPRKGSLEVWQAFQKEQCGTGQAVSMALPLLPPEADVLIVNGDGPLLSDQSLKLFIENHRKTKASLSIGVMERENPLGYGRVVSKNGRPTKIVEEREASAKEKKIKVVNGGVYLVRSSLLKTLLGQIRPSSQSGEFYLTDIVALAQKAKKKAVAYSFDPRELVGVNDGIQLAEAEFLLRKRWIEEWQREGVRILAPEAFWPEAGVRIESGAIIGPNVVLQGQTIVEKDAELGPGSVLIDTKVGPGAKVRAYTHCESAQISARAEVGPFARLRAGSQVGEGAKVGNFVETKNTILHPGAKANHLSYLGDTEVGADANVGCGFIACNFDGVQKHKTQIGAKAFVGSGVQAVAPIVIGPDSYIASGSTVNRDVPAGALAVARAKQENKEGYATRLRSRMLSRKGK
jgi:bifunctional UDP-N-acetylglucosamine pyrophosphorylase / glucosamine-1-phosphate N-acetyltransferase